MQSLTYYMRSASDVTCTCMLTCTRYTYRQLGHLCSVASAHKLASTSRNSSRERQERQPHKKKKGQGCADKCCKASTRAEEERADLLYASRLPFSALYTRYIPADPLIYQAPRDPLSDCVQVEKSVRLLDLNGWSCWRAVGNLCCVVLPVQLWTRLYYQLLLEDRHRHSFGPPQVCKRYG